MSTGLRLLHGNRLLDELPDDQHRQVVSSGELVSLSTNQILCDQQLPLIHVYFPLTAAIAMMINVIGHPPLGMLLTGNEGVLGASLMLGVRAAPFIAIVQGRGNALRIPSGTFTKLLTDNPARATVLGRYLFVLMEQLSHTAACHRFHEVEPRLVRWLLLTHDRAHADSFFLTHLRLAEMLGVQRSAVTIAAGVLQQRNLISYARGVITIIDRMGLEKLSCECYGLLVADYQRQIT